MRCLDDIASLDRRDGGGNSVYVETALPYVAGRMGSVGDELSDDGQSLVYVPKFADAVVFSGVHVY